ncbi:hypothetical protein EDD85DRAFT_830698 [Armillaria nabsnona]|nr:hypothetical protein EDD85DRAFT_830698 [Armillaria nabsnona]
MLGLFHTQSALAAGSITRRMRPKISIVLLAYLRAVSRHYTESKDAKGRSKRRAVKILPQVSLLQSLHRMVQRKGFQRLVRDSRGVPRNANNDDDFVMKDMHDGSLWHDISVGIKREVGNYGTVRDTPATVGPAERLTDKWFGLHLNGNLDWFGALENHPQSSGPIYITIQDLQLGVRYLQVNTICLMVTPGPSEPTTEQLTNCMEPVMHDIRALKMGIAMEMYDNVDEEIIEEEVYADFICNNCDTPSSQVLQVITMTFIRARGVAVFNWTSIKLRDTIIKVFTCLFMNRC